MIPLATSSTTARKTDMSTPVFPPLPLDPIEHAVNSEERRTDWSQYSNEVSTFEKEYQGRLLVAIHKVLKPRLRVNSEVVWDVYHHEDGIRFINQLHGYDRTFLLSLSYPASRGLEYDLVRLEALLSNY